MIKYSFNIVRLDFEREYVTVRLIPEGDFSELTRNAHVPHEKMLEIFSSEDKDFIYAEMAKVVSGFDSGYQTDWANERLRKSATLSESAKLIIDLQDNIEALPSEMVEKVRSLSKTHQLRNKVVTI